MNEPLSDLGWEWVRFGDLILDVRNGLYKPAEFYGEGIPIYKMFNIGRLDGSWNLGRVDLIRLSDDELDKFRLGVGDIFINRVNSSELVGKCAVVNEDVVGGVFESKNMRVRVDPARVLPEFVTAWLNSSGGRRQITQRLKQIVGQATINQDDLRSLLIPLPSVDEQRRISALLDEHMTIVKEARAAAEVQLQTVEELISSYLHEVFEGENAQEWPCTRVEDLIVESRYGYTASADFSINEPKFLRITDIQDRGVDWENTPGCEISERDFEKHRLYNGDIVVARTGGTVGKSYLITSPPLAVCASYLIRLRTDREVIVPEYLYAFFLSDGYWQAIEANARGAGQPNVNAGMLKALELPVPPLEEQESIVKDLEDVFYRVEEIQQALQEQLDLIRALPSALLRQAFSGEL